MSQQPPPPPPMADLSGPVIKAAGIFAAAQLGLFKALADGPRSIPEIANATGGNETGIARLAEVLASVGYLERVGDRYANGPTPRAWLTPASQVDFTPYLLWGAEVWRSLEGLSQVVRRGGPERNLFQLMEERPEMGRVFARYMKASAQLFAEPIAQAVLLPDAARRLLDLGGSHGLHSMAFCRRHPNLKAVVFDLPVAVAETEETIAAEGLADRVSVQRGDYLKDEIGQGYDVVLCFDLIHGHTEDDNRHLVAKVAQALNPGGLAVIHDFMRTEPPDEFNAVFSLIMFLENGTRTHSYQEVTGWLTEAGLRDLKRIDLPPTGQSSIVTAVKAG